MCGMSVAICALGQEVHRDPVVTSDGLSYERAAVEAWLKDHSTSFVTGQPLPSKALVPNRALKKRLQKLGMIE